MLPLSKGQEPRIGDFCRSIVIGKDEAKKELILHLTYLVEEDQSLYINHLKLKGCIRDYDLVKLLETNIERRIFDLHLHWKLQNNNPGHRNFLTNQKYRLQR